MPIEVRPGAGRFLTQGEGRQTWHSFSFGTHYDPHNVGFGALVAYNDERLSAHSGYPDHPHVDVEILTWVISGALRHQDTAGHVGVLGPGEVQVLSAGSGVVHSEFADGDEAARFVQAWIRPDQPGLLPTYSATRFDGGGLQCLASGDDEGGLRINARGSAFHGVHLGQGDAVKLPDASRLHVFVASGAALLGDRRLAADDAARLLNEGTRMLTADQPDTTVLVWAMC